MSHLSLAGKVDWLFFDLGNTLVDEDVAATHRIAVLQAAMQQRGLHYDAVDIEQAIYQANEEFAPRVIARAMELLTGSTAVDAFLKQAPYEKKYERLYPETLPVLQQLATRYAIGIIGNQSPGTPARLEAFGIAPYIRLCLGSGDIGMSKPDPAIYLHALELTGCPPERAVMVGDRIDNDIVPAKALGMYTVRVLKGFARVQQPRCEAEIADLTVGSVDELLPVFLDREVNHVS